MYFTPLHVTGTSIEARGMRKQMPHGASHVREGVCAISGMTGNTF
jgi:hypothetical protein